MSTKYIQKRKDGRWTVSSSKAGKVSISFKTKKEAIMKASSHNLTTHLGIMIDGKWFMSSVAPKQKKPKASTSKKLATKKSVIKKPIMKADNVSTKKRLIVKNRSTVSKSSSKLETKENNDQLVCKNDSKCKHRITAFFISIIFLLVIIALAFVIAYFR
ncbi:hypothetical protein [Candidatus Mycoplasma mahonii]|uniref:hypothetical protein n=1 Tax=Candidatus Mycoplasma mahonii TaxID=3004105 RepID=UPI0026EEEE38|nr:hypothetical protein [Candidatus Mycoplasma mahonii]WKX02157.1 hypothetical protein O3I44_02015 [Candidatus Mycoplasma mahonii]